MTQALKQFKEGTTAADAESANEPEPSAPPVLAEHVVSSSESSAPQAPQLHSSVLSKVPVELHEAPSATQVPGLAKVPVQFHSASSRLASGEGGSVLLQQQASVMEWMPKMQPTSFVTEASVACLVSPKISGAACLYPNKPYSPSESIATEAESRVDVSPGSLVITFVSIGFLLAALVVSPGLLSDLMSGTAAKKNNLFSAVPPAPHFAALRQDLWQKGEEPLLEPALDLPREVKQGLGLALPNMVFMGLVWLTQLISFICMRQVGSVTDITALALVNMLQTCTYLSFGHGICNVLDTLVSRAFGAGDRALGCTYLQRCRVVLTAQLIWILPLFFGAETIFLAIGQDPLVAASAGRCCFLAAAAPFFFFHSCAAMWFLRNQGDILPNVVIAAVGVVAHALLCNAFVIQLGWGMYGVGLAYTCSAAYSCFFASAYLAFFSDARDLGMKKLLWVGEAAFDNLGSYVGLAIPCIVSASSQFWFWELSTLVAGFLGPVQLQAHIGVSNLMSIMMRPAGGLASVGGTLVGMALGANKPRKAQNMVVFAVVAAMTFWTILAGALLLFHSSVIAVYTSDPEVSLYIEQLMFLVVLSGFMNVGQTVLVGCLRGLGMPLQGASVQLLFLFGISLPLGAYLSIGKGWGIFGIYWAFIAGMSAAFIGLLVALSQTDYKEKCKEAVETLGQDQKLASS